MSTAIEVSAFSSDPGLMSYTFQTDLAPGLDERDKGAVWNLLAYLRICAGSAVQGAFAISAVTDPDRWRPLAHADRAEVLRTVNLVEQQCAPWRLPGDPETPVIERLDQYFAAVERRAREAVGR
jgi:hypothetical protein